MRRIRFYIYYLLRRWRRFATAAFERWLLNQLALESVEGIKIVDISQRREIDRRFHTDTVAALHLVRSVDPRRFRRLQREIRYIVNNEAIPFASYDPVLKACNVDYGRHEATDNAEWYMWWYAATLVHEATDGAIFSRYIEYTAKLRSRIERLCHTEERRFATRSDTPERRWSDALVGPFDEQVWHDSWNLTYFQRVRRQWTRFRESRRNAARDKSKLQ